MLYIYLNDGRFRYEIEELIKLFIPPSLIEFIEEDTLGEHQSFLLIISIYKGNTSVDIQTKLIREGSVLNLKRTVIESETYDKKNIKDHIKRFVFQILSKHYQYEPPWGILTGVRPTKIVNELISKGLSVDKIIHILKETYLIADEKINLLMQVCKNQEKVLKNNCSNKVSVYIGIPFCPTRCAYCSFTSYQVIPEQMKQYLNALKEEIAYIGETLIKLGLEIETLYIGGGTPTSLSEEQLEELFSNIDRFFAKKSIIEYTVECGRPDTLNLDKFKIIKAHGVGRISINPQSMREETLKEIGRKHAPFQIIDAFRTARECGFNNINMDLIAGLPGELPKDFKRSLDTLLKLNPENITVHTLALKKSSKLRKMREEYNYESEDNVKAMLNIASESLINNHYQPYYMYRQKYMSGNYENVGYCKEDYECIYNIRIMEEKQTIIALGAGGISKVYYPSENRLERVPNVSNYEVYIERLDEMIQRKKKLIFANIDNKISNTL